MYRQMLELFERPLPFSVGTAADLWTDEYVSARMLEHHLDPNTDLASRRPEMIDKIVDWMDAALNLRGKSVCDLGCGPGLYAERMARHGAAVTGVDFSRRSIAYARKSAAAAGLNISYSLGDYLTVELPGEMDAASLIYGDFCVLSPEKRRVLLDRIRTMLKPGGQFVFDVFSRGQYEHLKESVRFERRLMDGFWAAGDYFGFAITFLYPERHIALDRYAIFEPDRRRDVYNWMQYFTPEEIAEELAETGFAIVHVADLEIGGPWRDGDKPFGVVARRND